MDSQSAVVEWQGRLDRLFFNRRMAIGGRGAGQSGARSDYPAGFRRGRGSRGPVLRARELVPRRRSADAVHRVALWRAESGATDVPAENFAGGFDPGVEVFRFGAA